MERTNARTLLVPGALLPAGQAAEILAAVRLPQLAGRLASARWQATHHATGRCLGAAHWSWLAHTLGVAADPPVTAPYAWRALGDAARCADEAASAWIAHCDPVHIVVARDHLRAADLGDEPLTDGECSALLALANEAARASGGATGPGGAPALSFAVRDGQWFVQAPAELSIQTWPLDAVLGRSIQACLPAGSDARAWRRLENEIQMMWHASAVSEAREARGARAANALWLHGGGSWQALAGRGIKAADPLGAAPYERGQAVLHGWLEAGAAQPAARPAPARILALHEGLFAAHAQRAWDRWLGGLAQLEARIEDEAGRAMRDGATTFELVLCGAREARRYRLAARPPGGGRAALGRWLRRIVRPGGAPRGPGPLGCLVENEAAAGAAPPAR